MGRRRSASRLDAWDGPGPFLRLFWFGLGNVCFTARRSQGKGAVEGIQRFQASTNRWSRSGSSLVNAWEAGQKDARAGTHPLEKQNLQGQWAVERRSAAVGYGIPSQRPCRDPMAARRGWDVCDAAAPSELHRIRPMGCVDVQSICSTTRVAPNWLVWIFRSNHGLTAATPSIPSSIPSSIQDTCRRPGLLGRAIGSSGSGSGSRTRRATGGTTQP